ncbi:hypothetical protein N0V92_009420 [Colletotrichum tropicale]|nr:hypothetical protein N0V92_009420 [Colletotrichum tropicale]
MATVHADAAAMMYSNTFEIEDMEHLEKWLLQVWTKVFHIRAIKLTQPFQASGARRNEDIGNFPLWNQRDYRTTSRHVARLLIHCEDLESLDLGFRYTMRYQNKTLLKATDNPKPWEEATRLLTEMVFSDFYHLLAAGKSFDKTVDQLANLLKIHPQNFEYISWYYDARQGEDPERESARHMKLLVEQYIPG